MRIGFHNQATAGIKKTFDLVDETDVKDGSISLDEWIKFGKSNKFNLDNPVPDNRISIPIIPIIEDRLTNALESSFFDTDGKYIFFLASHAPKS